MVTAKSLSEKLAKKDRKQKRNYKYTLKNNLREKRESLALTAKSCAASNKIAPMRYRDLELGMEPRITEAVALMAFFECDLCSDLWPDIKDLGY